MFFKMRAATAVYNVQNIPKTSLLNEKTNSRNVKIFTILFSLFLLVFMVLFSVACFFLLKFIKNNDANRNYVLFSVAGIIVAFLLSIFFCLLSYFLLNKKYPFIKSKDLKSILISNQKEVKEYNIMQEEFYKSVYQPRPQLRRTTKHIYKYKI